MIETVKVSSRGQIVIPENMRKFLKIREGTKLIAIGKGRRIILEQESDFLVGLSKAELEKEKDGWLALAEKSLSKVWDNPKDEEIWEKYL